MLENEKMLEEKSSYQANALVRTAASQLPEKKTTVKRVLLSTQISRHVTSVAAWKFRVTRNLVDPASSHMLVSRIKPCKSQSKWINSGSADGSLNQQ